MRGSKILLVDLLYSEHGSYSDDFDAISKALPELQFDYLKCYVGDGLSGALRAYRKALSFPYDKVVFLSAKLNQLVILAPLSLLRETYAIYHFMPNSRVYLHSRLLPVLSKCFHFATYANAVSDLLGEVVCTRLPALPSRIVDKTESALLLREKFTSSAALRVFIPGARPGVRKYIDPQKLHSQLQESTGAREIHIFIQGEPVNADLDRPNIDYIRKGIPKVDYDSLYRSCHLIAVEFDESYEVRASGIILDAAASGCLILTTEHPINQGYGFPNSILCNLERIGALIERVRSGQSLQPLFPGAGVKEFSQQWRSFLGI